MSQNVAYDLFVPSDTRRDHCISASTAVCVVSPNFIGQASGNSTKTWPLRRTPTFGLEDHPMAVAIILFSFFELKDIPKKNNEDNALKRATKTY